MKSIVAFFKLIRIFNLLIIAFTMYCVRLCLVIPFSEYYEMQSALGDDLFAAIVLSIILIAAAGYAINDYFDVKIDRVNKPDSIIVGRLIKRRVAMITHIVFTTLGLLLGFYVSFKIGIIQLVFLHFIMAVSLWYYSVNFKAVFLAGNLIIAFLTALVPITVGFFEIPLLNGRIGLHPFLPAGFNYNFLAYWILGYAIFAFLMTLMREIMKDIVDMKGDEEYGCETLPIVLGIPKTKLIVLGLTALTVVLLGIAQYFFLYDKLSIYYIYGLLVAPLVSMFLLVIKAKDAADFKVPEIMNKIISLFGISYMILIWYMFKYTM